MNKIKKALAIIALALIPSIGFAAFNTPVLPTSSGSGSQTPLTADVAGANHSISNLNTVTANNIIATSTIATSTISNLNTVGYDVSTFPGADIGAQLDAVYAALYTTHATANIGRGSFNFSTEIIENTSGKALSIACDPGGGTTLNWTGGNISTSTFLDWGQSNGANGFINNCKFTGQGTTTQQVAIEIGKTNGVRDFALNNVEIQGFGKTGAVVAGSNAYLLDFNDDFVHLNGKAFMDIGSTNFGEAVSFNGGMWGDCNSATPCVDTGSGAENFNFNLTSLDNGQLNIGASTHMVTLNGNNIESSAGDFAPTYTPVVIQSSSGTNVSMTGVDFVQGANVNCPAQSISNGAQLTVVSATSEQYGGCHVANFITNTGNGSTKVLSINKQDSAYTNLYTSTGGTGVFSFFIADNGNVGVGTSSPQVTLDVTNLGSGVPGAANSVRIGRNQTQYISFTGDAGADYLTNSGVKDFRIYNPTGGLNLGGGEPVTTLNDLYINAQHTVGLGTTTAVAMFQVATSTLNATTTMEVGKANQNKGSCMKLYRTDGTAIYAYVAAGATTFTLSISACATVTGF